MSLIHPTAIISPDAQIGPGVTIGPYSILEAGVVVGEGCRIGPHAVVRTGTRLGRDNAIHANVVLGDDPQDLGFGGAATFLEIGDRNIFREGFTAHRGTKEGTVTRIGNDCFLMTSSHVAHNCVLGDRVILASGAVVGGHAQIGDRVFLSGNTSVHQHVRVGRLALLQGNGALNRDLPPFCIASGIGVSRGINVIGLRRAGLDAKVIAAIRRAYRVLFVGRPNLRLAQERLLDNEQTVGGPIPEVHEMLDFIAASQRGVCFATRGRSSQVDSD